MASNYKFLGLIFLEYIILKYAQSTIDMNSGELQYLADHMTPEECRTLIAAAHFKSYEQPNSLEQAERKIEKDIPCIDLLHHWNSIEGRGETHELLERRLRQMNKYDLADWLGKTVFHNLVRDANRSFESGLEQFTTEESTFPIVGPTLEPVIQDSEAVHWTALDSILYTIVLLLLITAICLGIKFCCVSCVIRSAKTKEKKRKRKSKNYESLQTDTSGSESEDKFDVRQHVRNP